MQAGEKGSLLGRGSEKPLYQEGQGLITSLSPKRVLLRIQNGKIPKPVAIEITAKGQVAQLTECSLAHLTYHV